jgi:hypothetical protein
MLTMLDRTKQELYRQYFGEQILDLVELVELVELLDLELLDLELLELELFELGSELLAIIGSELLAIKRLKNFFSYFILYLTKNLSRKY